MIIVRVGRSILDKYLISCCIVILRASSRLPVPRATIVEEFLIRRVGSHFFDADYYRRQNRDVDEVGMDLLRHYVRHGAAEGRTPHPFINETWYRTTNMDRSGDTLTAVGHFLVAGRNNGASLNAWFDPAYYASANADVRAARMDPAEHYFRFGWRENRRPSRQIDPAAWLPAPDSADKLEPFILAYIRAVDSPGACQNKFIASTPDLADIRERIDALQARPSTRLAEVDVIVPVYAGHRESLLCILRVLEAANECAYELVVVEDASPEPELSADLQRLADRGLVELIFNPANIGFVASINRATALHPDRDVIWLNSDTEVFGNWIDRLRSAAYADPAIATATPLTNNGTICSYPRFCKDNHHTLELSWAELDAIAAEANKGVTIDLPTAVAFATYVKRAAIEVIGELDQAAFGMGYGEENDFCRRGRKRGWRDVLAADVFVRHLGGMSFGAKRGRRVERALKIISRRYPDYLPEVRSFIRTDPPLQARRGLDMARLKRVGTSRNILVVTHRRGGGTDQFIAEETTRLKAQNESVYLMRPGEAGTESVQISHEEVAEVPSLEQVPFIGDGQEISDILAELEIVEIHIHQLVDFGVRATDIFGKIVDRTGAILVVNVHDYYPVCPRINLVNRSGIYCGEPDKNGCRTCLRANGSSIGAPDIVQWRLQWDRLLARADTVNFPSMDVMRRFWRYYPTANNFNFVPHETVTLPPPRHRNIERRPLRIGVIGAIGKIKGFDVLLRCAKLARKLQLPVTFVVIGHTADDRQARRLGIEVTGPYTNREVDRLIQDADLDLIFLPSTWPETFSYTLSIALRTGLPVAAFEIGAIAERLRETDRGIYLPLEEAGLPTKLIERLTTCRSIGAPGAAITNG